MKAVYIKEFGGPEKLELREIPNPPKLQNNQVLLRVKAAGVNRADLLQVGGNYAPPSGYSPNIPGLEFAGEIVETGQNASTYSVGDRVFGITAGEAQAEFLVIDQSLLARIPDNLTFAEAAAVPEVFVTAHDALFTQGGLSKGESVLIHAVGSGVGLAGLQLAKALGSRVFGTSRTQDKLDRCEEFGLDVPIVVAKNPQFAEIVKENSAGNGVDVILDLVGGSYFDENLASLALKGRLMLVGLTGGRSAQFDLGIALHKRITIKGTVLRARPTKEKAKAMTGFEKDVVPLLATGVVRPNLDKVFPAADVIEAYKYLASNESFGKVVLEF
jgi:putative PIG3 family NAD(P)H quinone oxidoreductase